MPGIVLKRNCDCRIFVMLQFRTGSRVWRRVSFAAEFAEFRIVSVTPYRLWTARRKPQQNQNLFWLMQSDVVRLRFNEVRSLYIYKKSTIPCYSITLNRTCFNRVSNFANLNATLTTYSILIQRILKSVLFLCVKFYIILANCLHIMIVSIVFVLDYCKQIKGFFKFFFFF